MYRELDKLGSLLPEKSIFYDFELGTTWTPDSAKIPFFACLTKPKGSWTCYLKVPNKDMIDEVIIDNKSVVFTQFMDDKGERYEISGKSNAKEIEVRIKMKNESKYTVKKIKIGRTDNLKFKVGVSKIMLEL